MNYKEFDANGSSRFRYRNTDLDYVSNEESSKDGGADKKGSSAPSIWHSKGCICPECKGKNGEGSTYGTWRQGEPVFPTDAKIVHVEADDIKINSMADAGPHLRQLIVDACGKFQKDVWTNLIASTPARKYSCIVNLASGMSTAVSVEDVVNLMSSGEKNITKVVEVKDSGFTYTVEVHLT